MKICVGSKPTLWLLRQIHNIQTPILHFPNKANANIPKIVVSFRAFIWFQFILDSSDGSRQCGIFFFWFLNETTAKHYNLYTTILIILEI